MGDGEAIYMFQGMDDGLKRRRCIIIRIRPNLPFGDMTSFWGTFSRQRNMSYLRCSHCGVHQSCGRCRPLCPLGRTFILRIPFQPEQQRTAVNSPGLTSEKSMRPGTEFWGVIFWLPALSPVDTAERLANRQLRSFASTSL